MNIKNIEDLRNHAVGTLRKLEREEIDVEEAGVTGKLYENIMSSLKTEMEYHKMLGQSPRIKFLEGATVIDINKTPSQNKLTQKLSK